MQARTTRFTVVGNDRESVLASSQRALHALSWARGMGEAMDPAEWDALENAVLGALRELQQRLYIAQLELKHANRERAALREVKARLETL